MVRGNLLRRVGSALGASALVILLGSSYSFAAECTGPDDPDPTCTPAPTSSVTPDPVPSVAPDPAASVAADPATVQLDAGQFDALLWVGGAVLMVSIVGVVGSWSR